MDVADWTQADIGLATSAARQAMLLVCSPVDIYIYVWQTFKTSQPLAKYLMLSTFPLSQVSLVLPTWPHSKSNLPCDLEGAFT